MPSGLLQLAAAGVPGENTGGGPASVNMGTLAIAEADGMQPIVPQDIPGCDVGDSGVERGLPQLLLPAPPGGTGGAGPGPTAGGGAADAVHAAGGGGAAGTVHTAGGGGATAGIVHATGIGAIHVAAVGLGAVDTIVPGSGRAECVPNTAGAECVPNPVGAAGGIAGTGRGGGGRPGGGKPAVGAGGVGPASDWGGWVWRCNIAWNPCCIVWLMSLREAFMAVCMVLVIRFVKTVMDARVVGMLVAAGSRARCCHFRGCASSHIF